jgi:hypothetical protein
MEATAMAEPPRNLGGRPRTGRKEVLQAAFDAKDAEAIQKIAERDGKGISATLRDLALAGLALQKGKRK